MGVSALVSHAKGAKHKERINNYSPMSSLYFTKDMQSNDDSPTCSSSGSSSRIDSMLSSLAVCFTCRNLLGFKSSFITLFILLMSRCKLSISENVSR